MLNHTHTHTKVRVRERITHGRTFESPNTNDTEHKNQQHSHQQNIRNGLHRREQALNDCLQPFSLFDCTQRPKYAEHPENPDRAFKCDDVISRAHVSIHGEQQGAASRRH